MSLRTYFRRQVNVYRLSKRMQAAGFEVSFEPCPWCKTRFGRLLRKEEHICLRCSYGAMWPQTRAEFGFGEPYGPSFQNMN